MAQIYHVPLIIFEQLTTSESSLCVSVSHLPDMCWNTPSFREPTQQGYFRTIEIILHLIRTGFNTAFYCNFWE